MDCISQISRIYDHLENDRVDVALMNCLRLARSLQDYMNAAVFLREMYPARRDFIRALFDDTPNLSNEARKILDTKSLERWLDLHQIDCNWVTSEEGEEKDVFAVSILEIDHEINQWEQSTKEMTVPKGMGEFDTAAFTDSYTREKARIHLRIKALQIIKQRVKTRCLNYATVIERQFEAQKKPKSFLEDCQTEVSNYFMAHSIGVYEKLQKACQLVGSNNSEDHSLLLTQVRRSMKSAADYFFPSLPEPIVCADGKTRSLGEEQYLNRLEEFIARSLKKSTSRDLLRSELDYLSTFFRKLNDIASKGVHAAVAPHEAKQGLIGLYMFLFNIISHLQGMPSPNIPTADHK